jgi:hypothetical protein
MAKNFKNVSPLDNVSSTPKTQAAEVEQPTPTAKIEKPITDGTKKPGRPRVKTEQTKTVNIAVPVSVLEKLEVAKRVRGGNLTEYVNAVIAADLDANFDKYQELANTIDKI